MKISKLYLKLFLAFISVLIISDIVVFGMVLSDKLPPPMIQNVVEKAEMASRLIEKEMQGHRVSPDALCNRLSPLLGLMAKGFRGRIWLTDNRNALVCATFRGTPPEIAEEMIPVDLPPEIHISLFAINTKHGRSAYLESPVRLHDGTRLTAHILLDDRPRREEAWFVRGLLILTVLSAIFIIPVSRRITRPILLLSETADRLGQGDFSHRVPEKGNDEVAVLATKFNRMANRLEEMVKSGKELTAHISHELRTPLARMRISLQMVMERTESDGKDKTHSLLSKMQTEIENMDTLIGHLLDLSKLDLREPPPRTDHVDMTALIRSQLDQFDPMIERKNLSLMTNLASVPDYTCHIHGMHVVLENVLGNAIKYTDAGGALSVDLTMEENRLHIRICNTHAPLSEKDLEDMFTPFQRLDKGKEAGTGLGLAAVKKIVEIHEGTSMATYESGSVCMNIFLPT